MSLRDDLTRHLPGRVAVIGVGNLMRGDDAVGSLIARELIGSIDAEVLVAEDVPESIIGTVVSGHPDLVVLIDAVDFGASPGSAALLTRGDLTRLLPTPHHIPLPLLMEFLEDEGRSTVVLVAVQPRQLEFGAEVSDDVAQCAEALVQILREVFSVSKRGIPCCR